MTRARSAGVVLGRPGAGLESAGWAVNAEVARIGRTGEVRTAVLLDALAARPGGPAVLHDLRIPGGSANVDHVVVTGSRVQMVDAKVWAPGTYWTWAGVTRRGLERFAAADKRTMGFAVDALARFLTARGVVHEMAVPLVVVWPSSTSRSMRLRLLRVPGAETVTAEVFARRVGRSRPRAGYSPSIVAALAELLTCGGGLPAVEDVRMFPAPRPASIPAAGGYDPLAARRPLAS